MSKYKYPMNYYDDDENTVGYSFGNFPAGSLPVGVEGQGFRLSDSVGFNGQSGITKTSFPYVAAPVDQNNQLLQDHFQTGDLVSMSSQLPGKVAGGQTTMPDSILAQFDAGSSTFKSLSDAVNPFTGDAYDDDSGGNFSSMEEQHRSAYAKQQGAADLPLMPFSYTTPDFGDGKVDYGYADPNEQDISSAMVKAFQLVRNDTQLAGIKQDLQPIFSNVANVALDDRPIFQSLGKMKNTMLLGGASVYPPELRIAPREALMADSNIPTDMIETSAELAKALESIGYYGGTGISPYGRQPVKSQMVENTNDAVPLYFSSPGIWSIDGGNNYTYDENVRAF